MTTLPLDVIPRVVAEAVQAVPFWFVIGGQAVRCLLPYRPSVDVDFGVAKATHMKQLVTQLQKAGKVEFIERSADTVHLHFEGVDVSIFLLPDLAKHVEGRALTLTGLLATKAHAILDRGTRRDFFDLYVLLQAYQLSVGEVLQALADVYRQPINQGLVLRALSYFDDARAEARLPGEGRGDFKRVTDFFSRAVGALVVPPQGSLTIQAKRVDVSTPSRKRAARPKPATKPQNDGRPGRTAKRGPTSGKQNPNSR